jgi:regulator of sigma E protease
MSIESILGAVIVLALVIFVHELGHFLVAKWCDVEIHVFSMGFGPTLFARRWGETEYRLSAVPFGGYVRMAGEDGAEEPLGDPARGFSAKPLLQRAAIVAAGPGVNLVFAFLVFAATFFVFGESVPVERGLVGSVMADSPAAQAGLQSGDVVTAVDGTPVATWEALAKLVRDSRGRALSLEVQRADQSMTMVVTPKPRPERDYLGEVVGEAYMIGIERGLETRPVGAFASVGLGARYTWGFTRLIFETLARLFQGRVSASDLGGPIMIAQEAGRRAASGLEPLLRFMALISVNLGVINVLPVPVLDGGHLFFFLIEGVRGRPLSVRYREIAQQVGVFLLVALMVFVVFNDISRIVSG